MSGQDRVVEFFSNWAIYRAVIEHDCMDHRRLSAVLHEVLAERDQDFELLDLGCGDAAAIGPAMKGTRACRYVGMDCAAPALEYARQTLAPLDIRLDLRTAHMMDAIRECPERFDLILASFVLHHLDSAGKREFLERARERLKPGGELILVDVVRRDGQSRDEYLDFYAGLVGQWAVGPDRQARIIEHVRGHDFPEELSTQPRWAMDLGYTSAQPFYMGVHDTQAGWRFRL